ncbi:MAG TPA: tetratricopeptide repeat protein, partial [Chloroflexota bacterium]
LHHALARRDEASARVRAHALYAAGVLAFARGEYVQAEALLCESVAGYQQLGDQREIALALLHLGAARRDRGSDVEANTAIKEALELAREIGDHVLVGTLLMQRGIIERERGDLDSAQALFEETLALLSTQTLESPSLTTLTLQNLGALSEDQHDYVKANAYLNQSLILTRRTGNRFNLPFVLESVASLAAIAEQPEHALRLASAAAALRERLGMPVPPTWRPRIARTLERARVRLDPATAAAAWAEGGALTPEQALDYALNEETDA